MKIKKKRKMKKTNKNLKEKMSIRNLKRNSQE